MKTVLKTSAAWMLILAVATCVNRPQLAADAKASEQNHEPSPSGTMQPFWPPQTYEAAVARLVETLGVQDRQLLRQTPAEQLIEFHQGWGMSIRNTFGLWNPDSPLLKSCAARAGEDTLHPDDAAMLIIQGVWQQVQAKKVSG